MNVSSTRNTPLQSTQQPNRAQTRLQTEAQSQTQETARTQSQNPYQSAAATKPVVNTQGQTTGQLLNVSA